MRQLQIYMATLEVLFPDLWRLVFAARIVFFAVAAAGVVTSIYALLVAAPSFEVSSQWLFPIFAFLRFGTEGSRLERSRGLGLVPYRTE
jgi:hypothetical protein